MSSTEKKKKKQSLRRALLEIARDKPTKKPKEQPEIIFKREEDGVPCIVFQCIRFIYNREGLTIMGIFRIDPSTTLMEKYYEIFKNNGDIDLLLDDNLDAHLACGLLKQYFMNNVILDNEIYVDLKKNESIVEEEKINAIELGIKKLGEKDFNTLCYLFTLLNDIVRKQELNLMSAKAIATIWSPILFKDGEGVDLVEIMIKNCEKIYEKIKMRKRIEDIMAKKIDNNNFNELELDKKN